MWAARRTAYVWLQILVFPAVLHAERQVPGMLFRGGTTVSPPDVSISSELPRGHRVGWQARPTDLPYSCSVRQPVCVHGAQLDRRQATLSVLESAYEEWVFVLDMPAPLGDGVLGAGPELDLYLDAEESAPPPPDSTLSGGVQVYDDAPALGRAAASASCRASAEHVNRDDLLLCVAEAAAARIDAAAGPGVRRGWAQYQVSTSAGFSEPALRAIDDAQAHPQLSIIRREQTPLADAGLLWWAYVDRSLSVAYPGKLPLAMLNLSHQPESDTVAHPEWNNEPDVLDVLRRAFDNDNQRVADFLGGFAVSRLFLGARSDNAHSPGLPELGTWGRVRFDWMLPYSSLPRHVAGPYPLEPLGAAYVWVDLDSVPLTARLAFRAEWEEPVRFKWMVVSVDAQGREMNRWDVPYIERGHRVEKTIMNFQGAAGLVFVGVNLGGVDLSHPFDPDHEPWEPHAYSLYVTELP